METEHQFIGYNGKDGFFGNGFIMGMVLLGRIIQEKKRKGKLKD